MFRRQYGQIAGKLSNCRMIYLFLLRAVLFFLLLLSIITRIAHAASVLKRCSVPVADLGGCGRTPLASFRKILGLPISKIVRTADSTIIKFIITNFYLAASSHEIFLRVGGREGMKGLRALQRHPLPHPLAKILDPPLHAPSVCLMAQQQNATCGGMTRGPRKFWRDCKEVQHYCYCTLEPPLYARFILNYIIYICICYVKWLFLFVRHSSRMAILTLAFTEHLPVWTLSY